MLNPMREKMKACTEGEKAPRLVQKIAECKASYELSWKVNVLIKKKKKHIARGNGERGRLARRTRLFSSPRRNGVRWATTQ